MQKYFTLGLASCHALMPNRECTSYQVLFSELKKAIERNFGDMGVLHTVLLDHERAAQKAVEDVFQNGRTNAQSRSNTLNCLLL